MEAQLAVELGLDGKSNEELVAMLEAASERDLQMHPRKYWVIASKLAERCDVMREGGTADQLLEDFKKDF